MHPLYSSITNSNTITSVRVEPFDVLVRICMIFVFVRDGFFFSPVISIDSITNNHRAYCCNIRKPIVYCVCTLAFQSGHVAGGPYRAVYAHAFPTQRNIPSFAAQGRSTQGHARRGSGTITAK